MGVAPEQVVSRSSGSGSAVTIGGAMACARPCCG